MNLEGARNYPIVQRIGGVEVTLRKMTPKDRAAMLAFARSLPEHDLLFLRRDITQESEVDAWIRDIEQGHIETVLAESAGKLAGYATVHRNELHWSNHVAELRVTVSESMRGQGLGRVLTQEAFALALAAGIEKMIAQMTLDQKGAIAVFEGLGFRPEALLRDQVKDRAGTKHDLLVLSHEVATFERTLTAYGVADVFK
jgi:L-amino acid N-acyltransferase YncA